jgi:hypothetical protein
MTRSVVAVLRTKPETVLSDISRLMDLAGVKKALDLDATTILKDNISWHFPFLSANTTPWQLEGTIRGLREAGFNDLLAVHNNTVVTDPFKGSQLNKLEPIYKRYRVLEKYNFLPSTCAGKYIAPKPACGPCIVYILKGSEFHPPFWERISFTFQP